VLLGICIRRLWRPLPNEELMYKTYFVEEKWLASRKKATSNDETGWAD
jgi:hypothetical protein